MLDFAEDAINLLELRKVDYADVRIVLRTAQSLTVANEQPEGVMFDESFGFGVRVFHRGGWGFAASAGLNREDLVETVNAAVEISQSSRTLASRSCRFSEEPPQIARYATPFRIDPFNPFLHAANA